MATFTFEVVGYSPCAYDFYHLGVVTVEAETLETAYPKGWEEYTGPRKFGAEPVSMRIVRDKATHGWAKGHK